MECPHCKEHIDDINDWERIEFIRQAAIALYSLGLGAAEEAWSKAMELWKAKPTEG